MQNYRMNYCPRCGHELTTRYVQDHERPACPNCGYVAFLNPVLAVGVLATDEENRVVLILRGGEPGRGLWALPAGAMEADESVEECARRECLEETGLKVELDELWDVWSYEPTAYSRAGVFIVYRAHIAGGEPRAGSDAADVRFFKLDEIPYSQLAFSMHREALERLFASFNNPAT